MEEKQKLRVTADENKSKFVQWLCFFSLRCPSINENIKAMSEWIQNCPIWLFISSHLQLNSLQHYKENIPHLTFKYHWNLK